MARFRTVCSSENCNGVSTKEQPDMDHWASGLDNPPNHHEFCPLCGEETCGQSDKDWLAGEQDARIAGFVEVEWN